MNKQKFEELHRGDELKSLLKKFNLNENHINKIIFSLSRPPVKFIQFDDFTDPSTHDGVVRPDKDGHSIWSGQTEDMMTGIYTIRVLVKPNASAETIIKGLKKIAAWIKKDPEILKSRKGRNNISTRL